MEGEHLRFCPCCAWIRVGDICASIWGCRERGCLEVGCEGTEKDMVGGRAWICICRICYEYYTIRT